MISTCGLIWWMRFPAVAYMAAMSVLAVSQVGVRTRQPAVVRRGRS